MSWKTFAKSIRRMAESKVDSFWHKCNKSRANKWLLKDDNASKIILEKYGKGHFEYSWEDKVKFDRVAAHQAIGYIWRGELITPKNWNDEDYANAAGNSGDSLLIDVEYFRIPDDQERTIKILKSYISALIKCKNEYKLYLFLEDIFRTIQNGNTYPILHLNILESLSFEIEENLKFLDFVVKDIDSFKCADFRSFVEKIKNNIDKIEEGYKRDKENRELRKLCDIGIHNWISEGVWIYSKAGIPYKSELSKQQVCSRCGKKKER